MGLEINNDTIKALQIFADYQKGNKDGIIQGNEKEAIELFHSKVVEKYGAGQIDDTTFTQAMGLYKTQPAEKTAATTTPAVEEVKPIQTKKEIKEQESTNKGIRTATLAQLTTLVSQGATLDNVVDILNKRLPYDNYKDAIAQIEMFRNTIQDLGFNNKTEVDSLKNAVIERLELSGLDKTDKETLEKLVELAEKEQVQKEYETLVKLYNNVKATYPEDNENKHDFTFYKGYMNYAMEQEGLKGTSYYTGKAYNMLMDHIKKDCAETNEANRYYTKGETAKEVKKELKGMADKKDKMSRKYIKNAEENNALDARYNAFHQTAEELKTITEKDLKEKLGNKLFNKLAGQYGAGYLSKVKNEDGTYDLTALVEVFSNRMGNDYEIDKQQNAISEYHLIKQGLEGEFNAKTNGLIDLDLTKKEYEKLRDLCAVELAPKDHSFATNVLNLKRLRDAGIGAMASFLTAQTDIDHIEMNFTMDIKHAQEFHEQLKGYGVSTSIQEYGTTAVVGFEHLDIEDIRGLQALGGAAVGLIGGALLSMIIGTEKQEQACISTLDFQESDKDFSSYCDRIDREYPAEKAVLIKGLVGMFYDEDTNTFNLTDYRLFLDNAAGQGSLFGCDEVNGTRIKYIKEYKPEEKKQDQTPVTPEDPHTVAVKDVKAKDAVYKEVPTIDGTRTTWDKVAEMYDDECFEELDLKDYPNCLKRKGELKVRLIKVAQAVTNGDYSAENLLKLAEASFAAKTREYTELQNYEGIDHETLVNTMNATELGKVKVPDKLAGCNRETTTVNENIIKDEKQIAKGNDITKANERAVDKVIVRDGQDAKYYAKFDNGKEEEYASDTDRGLAIEDWYKKHNDNIKWQKWE